MGIEDLIHSSYKCTLLQTLWKSVWRSQKVKKKIKTKKQTTNPYEFASPFSGTYQKDYLITEILSHQWFLLFYLKWQGNRNSPDVY